MAACSSLSPARSATPWPPPTRRATSGPNLDVRLGSEIATEAGRKALVLNAIAEGRARGLGQMPAGLYQGRDAESIADFLAATAGH